MKVNITLDDELLENVDVVRKDIFMNRSAFVSLACVLLISAFKNNSANDYLKLIDKDLLEK